MNNTSLPKAVKVIKIIKENFRTKSFVLNTKINAKPGQFLMVWYPGVAEKPLSITNNNPLTVTVSAIGKFTSTLNSKIKPGDKLWYRGPYGNGVFKSTKGKKILVAGGCGCVPLYFLAKQIKDKLSTQIIIGAKTKKELLFINKFKKLGFKTLICTDDGSFGFKGYTTDLLTKLLIKDKIKCVYSCGPLVMLDKIAAICIKHKTKYQLSMEALMKCGFGICGSCSIGGKLVCKDGPVFYKWLIR